VQGVGSLPEAAFALCGDEARRRADALDRPSPLRAGRQLPPLLHRLRPAPAARPGNPQVRAAHRGGHADRSLRRREHQPRLHVHRRYRRRRSGGDRRGGDGARLPVVQPGGLAHDDAARPGGASQPGAGKKGDRRVAAGAAGRHDADAGRSDAVGTGARLRAEGFDRRGDRPLRDLAAVVAGLIAAGVVETGQARAAVAVAVLPVAVALSIAIAIASAPPPSAAAAARTAAPAAVARTLAVAGAAAMLLAAAVLLRLRAAGAVSAG